MTSALGRALVLALCWAAVGAAPAPDAPPHTQLEESLPGGDAVLESSPTRIWLRFSTEVQLALSEITLEGPGGVALALGSLEYDPTSDRTALQAALTPATLSGLTNGLYRVVWATAGPDSHPISDSFEFTLAQATPTQEAADSTPPDTPPTSGTTPEASASSPDAPIGQESEDVESRSGALSEAIAPLGLGARWFGLLSAVLLVGVAVFHGTVVRAAQARGEAEAVADFLPRLRGYAYVVTTAGLAAWLLRLVDGFVGFGASRIGALLFASPWGLSWWLFGVGAILAFIGVRRTGRTGTNRGGWRLLGLGALLTVISTPFAGHGWSAAQRAIAAPVHMIHTLSAGIWLGSLAVLVLVALPFLVRRKDSEGRSPEAAAWVASFSRVALIGVLLVLGTGVANSWLHVGGPQNLFGTTYGRTLLVKTGLLLIAMLLGFYNWRQVRPALEATGRPGLLKFPATVELLVGFAVLLVTAALLVLTPPS